MAKRMTDEEIANYINSKSIIQDQYVAPTVQTHVDTRNRVPAMAQVAQTVKPTQSVKTSNQPQNSFNTQRETNDIRTVDTVNKKKKENPKEKQDNLIEALNKYQDTINNSAVKNRGLSWDNAITDLANIYDAKKNVAKSIPIIGNLFNAADTIGKSALNVSTNMAEGALKTIEGAGDAASNLIFNPAERSLNYAYDLVTKGKKTADANLKDLTKMQQRDIKKNMTQEFLNATGYNDAVKDIEKGSLVKRDNFLGQVSQGVGGMVPSLVLGQAFGATPELTNTANLSGKAKVMAGLDNVGKTYISQLPSNAILNASSYGSAVEEALNNGATMEQARRYGLANAAIEQGTEMLTGGIPGLGGKGGIDNYVEPLINRNTNGYLNALLKAGYGAFGEGLEEKAGTYLDALARQNILGDKINWDDVRKESNKAFALGSATGAFLNAPTNIQDIQDVRTENQIRDAIGDETYAEGNLQYNPDYKGWEKQRETNRVEEERRETERQQRKAEYEKIQQERAQEDARKVQESQKEQERIREQEKEQKDNDYNKYYKRADLEKFDSNLVDKAKDVIASNKQGRRTKQEWLDIADNIGMQLKGQDTETIKKYAYESFKAERPNTKDNLNRQGKKYVSFKVDEWVDAVQKAAQSQPSLEAVQSNVETEQQIPQVDNKVEQQIERFKERGGRVEDTVPEGFVKTENATTAPKGYTWYNNGKSRFGGEYENVLVKDSTQNSQQIENLKQEIKQEERLVEQGKSDDGYHLAELQKELENLESNKNQKLVKNPNLAEKINEDVIRVETPQQERKHYVDSGMNEETAKILSEMPKVEKQPLRERIKEGKAKLSEEWSYLKRNLVDKGETIYTLGKKTKNPNLYAKYDKRGTTTGEANYDIGVAQTDLQGKRFNNFTNENGKKTSMSLNQIWEGVDPQVANEYLAHYLNVDRYNQINQDGTQKYVFGESITDKDSLQRVKELEREHPELKRFGENVWQYGKNQLQNMVDAGKISQAQADQFLKDTPHYVRLQRNVEKTSSPLLEFDKKGNVKVNKNIKEFKGSTLDILPFKESMAQYTLDVRNGIRDNIFAQELAKTLGIDGNGEKVTDLDEMIGTNPDLIKDNKDGTYSLTFFNKGVAKTIPINQGIYESLQPNKHFKFEDTFPFKGIRKFDNVRKALLTDKNPMFLATNMMKDAFDAPLNSKYPASFVKNYPRAVYEILKNGENYQQYQALGGLQNTYFDNQQFQKQGSKANPLTWIEKANNAIEQIPRLAEFMSTMEKTGDVDQAMYNAAEVTTNFKRGGDVTKVANRNGATFLNASVQGFSKQIRNFTDIQSPRQAAQMLGKVLALGIAPGLLNDLMWDDDDEYKDMQDYQKDRYYLFKGKDGQWIRIPKGRAVSIFQSAARRTKYALGGQKDAFKDFGKFASDQVAPNNPFENNIISPFVDVARNESWSGNPIVSESIKNETHPEEEYTIKTDEFSKWLGKKTSTSPAKINYLIDQYSGAVGDIVLPNITKKVTSKNDNVAENLLLNPIKDKFTTNAVTSSKSQNDFYEALSKAEDDKKWSKATDEDKAKYKYLYNKNLEISEIRKEMIKVQESNKSNKEKYEKVMDYTKKINKISKDAVENSNKVKKQNNNELVIGDKHYTMANGQVNAIKDETVQKAKDYGLSVGDYTDITSHYGTIKADKGESGNTIPGSKKQKFIDYVEAKKELTKQQKIAIIQKYYKKYTGE